MQYKTIICILGALLVIFSLTMLPPVVVSLIYNDGAIKSFLFAFIITFVMGFGLWLPFQKNQAELKTRDGFLIVVLIWVVLSGFGALPFLFTVNPVIHFTNAMFESFSGLTTTGATVFSGLDFFPQSLLFYRQQLQFLGGMGIIVLAVAIIPMLGIGGMQLYRAEVPGPIKESKLTPRITETAKTLWFIYIGLILICMLCYWAAGMTFFDALGESFATVSTGGFTMHDKSFAFYNRHAIEIIAMIFMLLGATNFSLHFAVLKNKNFDIYWRDREFRFYIYGIIFVTLIASLTLYLNNTFKLFHLNVLDVFFDTVSLMTTTGFVTGNFSAWPHFVPFLIMFFALIGGCGGSTSGGLKFIRILVILKQAQLELGRLIHPRSVMSLKFGNQILAPYVIGAVSGYIAIYLSFSLLFFLMIMASGIDVTTGFGAVAATISNAGATIGQIHNNFQSLSTLNKWICIFAMLLGRLEIFSILLLFTPGFWKH